MATLNLTGPAFVPGFFRAVSLNRLRAGYLAWRAEQRKRARIARELATYTDRELFDLGISRGDIPAIVRGTYRRQLPPA
jgi:uncharacterized protein YjiS (DUF1127 family)